MKTLLIFRHGKTEKNAAHGDRERALTARGERDTRAMARYLVSQAGHPDSIVASDAKRAQQTAKILAKTSDFKGKIATEPDIYGASLETLLKVIHHLPDRDSCVVLVGHNPGFEELGAALADEDIEGRHLPTAGVVHLEFDADHWKDARPGAGRLRGIYDPEALPTEAD
jgi:phosphohistidine phosphatase